MKSKYIEVVLLGLLLLCLAVFIGYQIVGNKAPVAGQTNSTNQQTYSTNLDELRTKFNQDKGKVRLVLLLSPS